MRRWSKALLGVGITVAIIAIVIFSLIQLGIIRPAEYRVGDLIVIAPGGTRLPGGWRIGGWDVVQQSEENIIFEMVGITEIESIFVSYVGRPRIPDENEYLPLENLLQGGLRQIYFDKLDLVDLSYAQIAGENACVFSGYTSGPPKRYVHELWVGHGDKWYWIGYWNMRSIFVGLHHSDFNQFLNELRFAS